MKIFLKTYAIISALILFILTISLALFAESFGNIFTHISKSLTSDLKVFEVYTSSTFNSLDKFVLTILLTYIINIPVIAIMLALAHISEHKFAFNLIRYLLIIYLIIFVLIAYFIKLATETVFKTTKGAILSLGKQNAKE